MRTRERIGGAALGVPEHLLDRALGEAQGLPVETSIRQTRLARHVNAKTFQQTRRVEVELFENASLATLQTDVNNWMVANAGKDVIDIQLNSDVAVTFDTSGVLVTTVKLFTAQVLYAEDNDRQTFEDAINDWCDAGEEKEIVDVLWDISDRVYRAVVLWAE